jgi:hypothetical protein
MSRFVGLRKSLTCSVLVLMLMISHGCGNDIDRYVKDVLGCNFTNHTEIHSSNVSCSEQEQCNFTEASITVYNLNISWNESVLDESCVFFICYNDSNETNNASCALYEVHCGVICDITDTENNDVDKGGGSGSSAETGLIVFVVLLIVALIGSVVAIVILAWMVREMQSEREGKALPNPISCIVGILPLSIFHSSDEKPAKSTSHTKQKDKRSSEPQHHRQKDDDKRASSDLEGESPDHDADDYEEMDPMKRGSFIAVDDDIYQNN